MQTDPLLHEALANQSRISRFNSDSGSSAIEEPVPIEHRLHAEFGEQFAIELAGDLKPAHRQDDVSHSIDTDCHRSRLSLRRATNAVQMAFGCQTASISARACVSSMPSTSRR